MEMIVGYKLIDAQGSVCQQWGGAWGVTPDVPNPIILPTGEIVYCPIVGTDYFGYHLENWVMQEPPPPVPASISRRQCATQLRNIGNITQSEALGMASTAAIPPSIQLYFDAMDPVDRDNAQLEFTATEYSRSNPLLNAIMTANGLSSQEIDNFFIEAAKL